MRAALRSLPISDQGEQGMFEQEAKEGIKLAGVALGIILAVALITLPALWG